MIKVKNQVRSLKDIIQYEIPPLLRRQHLNRDLFYGLVGDRGDGKTSGGVAITILDYMVANEPCWSNMAIGVEFEISDELAKKYGFEKGGTVFFKSLPLDKNRFLAMDEEYHDGVFFIDEINLWLADARRSTSNQNLFADDVGQQLRKLNSALVCTCISEMFIDVRLRDMADAFIQTRDLALSRDGLATRKPPGIDYQWRIFPMSRKLTGERYSESHETISLIFHGKQFHGTFDTWEKQERKKLIKSKETANIPMAVTMTQNTDVIREKKDWTWLNKVALRMTMDGRERIPVREVLNYPEVRAKAIGQVELSRQINALFGITTGLGYIKNGRGAREQCYNVDDSILDERKPERVGHRMTTEVCGGLC